MSISNRRTGKIGPPPGSYDTEWLNRLRILLEELAGASSDTLPDGEARNLLAYRASGTAAQIGWKAYHADNFGFCEVTSVDEIDEL